jgi:hypothetical protein
VRVCARLKISHFFRNMRNPQKSAPPTLFVARFEKTLVCHAGVLRTASFVDSRSAAIVLVPNITLELKKEETDFQKMF